MIRSADRSRRGRCGPVPLMLVAAAAVVGSAMLPLGPRPVRGESAPDHLVISELVTGGASASDELIELYNPTDHALPLEGLELVYVTASGLTVSRRAAWDAGAPELGPGRHLLVANEAGLYAGIADASYSSGIAATGGSVALRIQGASSAIDALGWGNAASTWAEGTPAPAPAAGASLERLPGGAFGSTRDSDDNAADFVERDVPDPQNTGSPPAPDPDNPPSTPTPGPSPTASPLPTPTPSPAPSATPDPAVSVATARAVPDGTTVTIEAIALTGSAFTEGGGYVADSSAGIAVLLTSGSFERGARLRITGTVNDRFAQRTLRSDAVGLTILGTGAEPAPVATPSGAVSEALEGRLVRVAGAIGGTPTQLSAGLAYDLDDGSGPVRVVVATATDVDTSGWSTGSFVELVGVVGQRDSTGTGASGYRVQPRDDADVLSTADPSPSASASPPSPTGSPSPSAAPPGEGLVTIAEARSMAKNTRTRVRGTVTMAPGVIDPVSAVIQDATGAILLRVADEVGPLSRGDRVEVSGTRSTLAGMETLRVTAPAVRLGSGSELDPATLRTGDAGEAHEALLVSVRGAVVASARRVASGTVSFEIDDGSGPLRIFLAAGLGADAATFPAGAWVEAVGVLGQETTGAQPLRGYRVWPRSAGEVRVGATPSAVDGGAGEGGTAGGSSSTGGTAAAGGGHPVPSATLEQIGSAQLASLHIMATVVLGPWPELAVGGLLWDGDRLVTVDPSSSERIRGVLGDVRPPLPVQLTGLHALGMHERVGVPVVRLGPAATDAVRRDGPPDPPRASLPETGAAWVSLVGRLTVDGDRRHLEVGGDRIALQLHCDDATDELPAGTVMVSGIGLVEPSRVLVPCDGVRPAPAIDRTSARLPGTPASASPDGARGTPTSAPSEPSGRLLAAGLLAAGALLVAGAGTVVRRLDPDPAPDDPSPAQTGEPAETDEAPAGAPPALTLVSVPHKRGSP